MNENNDDEGFQEFEEQIKDFLPTMRKFRLEPCQAMMLEDRRFLSMQ